MTVFRPGAVLISVTHDIAHTIMRAGIFRFVYHIPPWAAVVLVAGAILWLAREHRW